MKFYYRLLKISKQLYDIAARNPKSRRDWMLFSNKEYSNNLIAKMILSNKPFMIARFGSTEMENIVNYLGIIENKKNIRGYIKGETLPWWWDSHNSDELCFFSGFFPNDTKLVFEFCKEMIEIMPNVDLLGSWLKEEWLFKKQLQNAKRVVLEDLEPFFCSNPWTQALEGKKVLVIHPFAETIEAQYEKRKLIYPNGLLPDFDLTTIKAVQTICETKSSFDTWFDALDYMKEQVKERSFDIAIIGCGAYGFPLASYIKDLGKQAIHMGGVTQILFGIKGSRYEGSHVWPYMNLFNEYWVRPGESETPKDSNKIEGNCYW
jgi:hypothetical protein